MTAKVFNLTSRVNEARLFVQHDLYQCNCRLNVISECNSKQNGIIVNIGVSEKN